MTCINPGFKMAAGGHIGFSGLYISVIFLSTAMWPLLEDFEWEQDFLCDRPFLRYRASNLQNFENSRCSTALNNIVITFFHVFYIFYRFHDELWSRCRYRFRVVAVFGRRAKKINFNVFYGKTVVKNSIFVQF